MQKKVLITGGTSGIGHSSALLLAEKGFDVYIVGRSPEACEALMTELRTVRPQGNFGYYVCDLLSQEQIKRTAEQIR